MSANTADIDQIQNLIGTISAHHELSDALDENHDGVLALAQQIHANPKLTRKAGAFIAAIRRGEHNAAPRPARPDTTTAREAFFRLYSVSLRHLQELEWRTQHDRQLEALDYAASTIQHCKTGPLPPGGVGQLEDELCRELGISRGATDKLQCSNCKQSKADSAFPLDRNQLRLRRGRAYECSACRAQRREARRALARHEVAP